MHINARRIIASLLLREEHSSDLFPAVTARSIIVERKAFVATALSLGEVAKPGNRGAGETVSGHVACGER